jgi:hypothetical protein
MRSFNAKDYDVEAPGWKFRRLKHGQDRELSLIKKGLIYDTTLPGYSNAGHEFGDALSDDERKAVVEYLKTL